MSRAGSKLTSITWAPWPLSHISDHYLIPAETNCPYTLLLSQFQCFLSSKHIKDHSFRKSQMSVFKVNRWYSAMISQTPETWFSLLPWVLIHELHGFLSLPVSSITAPEFPQLCAWNPKYTLLNLFDYKSENEEIQHPDWAHLDSHVLSLKLNRQNSSEECVRPRRVC